MSRPQLYPLDVNAATGEPFLRLRDLPDIIITPPRLDDARAYLPIMNDERVYKWLKTPPYPYELEHAETWLMRTSAAAEAVLAELASSTNADAALKVVGGCPVNSLRHVRKDGSDVFIGAIDIARCGILAELERDRTIGDVLQRENDDRLLSDPDIVWTIGNYLAPEYHGKGIMTDALRTVMQKWAIPRMGVRKILATAYLGNRGSARVFEKNGYTKTRDVIVPDAKYGHKGYQVFEWRM
ncbi:hypothetical protein FISHEDRAFT_69972 [Fistulina hepatica ATCC 64428]|uniref:N-acetyltransferase domain-containing protein n=1 Tax=Fistulina hepatica ATCC 64428 TaxID=1128425 RepID=A0A0D7ALV5_9AGAR|nr:hypothetical protein FISHEDRAFT_69972 [Fistulina hepatica ATCC 64428]